eukprot:626584_1
MNESNGVQGSEEEASVSYHYTMNIRILMMIIAEEDKEEGEETKDETKRSMKRHGDCMSKSVDLHGIYFSNGVQGSIRRRHRYQIMMKHGVNEDDEQEEKGEEETNNETKDETKRSMKRHCYCLS